MGVDVWHTAARRFSRPHSVSLLVPELAPPGRLVVGFLLRRPQCAFLARRGRHAVVHPKQLTVVYSKHGHDVGQEGGAINALSRAAVHLSLIAEALGLLLAE